PTGWVDPLGLSCKVGDCPGPKGKQKNKPPAGLLVTHERAGGHLIRKHVGRTDEQLAARFESEPNLPASSSFKSLEEAETIVSKSLAKHQQEIINFKNGNKSKLIIKDNSTNPVGVSILKETTEPIPVYNFVLVLKRAQRMPDGYLLLTGFPEK
ncbi:hypothetical protein HX795_30015, partial [Pseudomonas edaphica]